VVWREVPALDIGNDESRSHIRGSVVFYFVEDGLYDTQDVPLPLDMFGNSYNVVISDITGTCPTVGQPCYSNEDPNFPDVSASYGDSAVVVWHQQYPPNPNDLDVFGDFFNIPSPCMGDFNGDNDVDGSDLEVFAEDFGRTNCSGDCEGDFDGDNDVDGSDLAVFDADFGRTDCP
jgi:hypothetical protein